MKLLLLVAHWWSQIRSMALLLFDEKKYIVQFITKNDLHFFIQ
jgi:hypothetical protein